MHPPRTFRHLAFGFLAISLVSPPGALAQEEKETPSQNILNRMLDCKARLRGLDGEPLRLARTEFKLRGRSNGDEWIKQTKHVGSSAFPEAGFEQRLSAGMFAYIDGRAYSIPLSDQPADLISEGRRNAGYYNASIETLLKKVSLPGSGKPLYLVISRDVYSRPKDGYRGFGDWQVRQVGEAELERGVVDVRTLDDHDTIPLTSFSPLSAELRSEPQFADDSRKDLEEEIALHLGYFETWAKRKLADAAQRGRLAVRTYARDRREHLAACRDLPTKFVDLAPAVDRISSLLDRSENSSSIEAAPVVVESAVPSAN